MNGRNTKRNGSKTPSVPKHLNDACALIPPRTPQERCDLYRLAKEAFAFWQQHDVKPDLIEAYQQHISSVEPTNRNRSNTMSAATKKAARPAKAAAPIVKTGLRFHVDGEPIADAINCLSEMGQRQMTPRMKVADFKTWLAKQGVKNPLDAGWSVKLPNGRTLSTSVLGTPAEKPVKATPAKSAAKPAAKAAKAPTAPKSAEGNGSLKRDKVTPIPKAKNASAKHSVSGKRITKTIPRKR